MKAELSNVITVTDPTLEFIAWCNKELTLDNPEYVKKARMGFWLGNVPKSVKLYSKVGEAFIVPYGTLKEVIGFKPTMTSRFTNNFVEFGGLGVPLYDYQQSAVNEMLKHKYGILQSKAGSGKTQMGIAIAKAFSRRTLWLTHTIDLLNQSKARAEQFIDKDKIGVVASGKVEIGSAITFATVQTMSKLDLTLYRDLFDVIIVDECHRCCTTVNDVTMFGKVLNNLSAQYKFGLSATVHRADGMIKGCFALLGGVNYIVPDEAIADKVLDVTVEPVYTDTELTYEYLDTDGTIKWSSLIECLTNNEDRNRLIVSCLDDKSTLILSCRTGHLESLINTLSKEQREQSVYINGKMTSKKAKLEREQAIEQMRKGEKKYLFATYQLAKEGLDIPRLERLILATPEKDYAVIVQSVGRVARKFDGKSDPIVYDIVDGKIRTLVKKFKERKRIYKKENIKVNE